MLVDSMYAAKFLQMLLICEIQGLYRQRKVLEFEIGYIQACKVIEIDQHPGSRLKRVPEFRFLHVVNSLTRKMCKIGCFSRL